MRKRTWLAFGLLIVSTFALTMACGGEGDGRGGLSTGAGGGAANAGCASGGSTIERGGAPTRGNAGAAGAGTDDHPNGGNGTDGGASDGQGGRSDGFGGAGETTGGANVSNSGGEHAQGGDSSAAGDPGNGGAGSASGNGGAGGETSAPWPSCDSIPAGVIQLTIQQLWELNPPQPSRAWLEGLVVTSITGGTCRAGVTCEVSLQSAASYPSLAEAKGQAIMLHIAANVASNFSALQVGRVVNVDAYAVRYTNGGRNELLLLVNQQLPACTKVTGVAFPVAVQVSLSDLTVDAYENELGPVLVSVQTVSGKPAQPTSSFGLYATGSAPPVDGSIVSASPNCLSAGSFNGLTAAHLTDFTSATGTFHLLVSGQPVSKYLQLCARSMGDLPIAAVH